MRFGIVRILKFILCSLFHTTSFVLDYPTNKSGYVPEKKEVEIDNTNDQFHCFRNNNQKKKSIPPIMSSSLTRLQYS